jgi:hypothetical protein
MASTADESPERPTAAREYSGLIILAVLAAAETGMLYGLIVLETPLTPAVHRMLETPVGVFALVMCVVGVLILGMIGFTSWAEWLHRKRTQAPGD